MSSGGQTASSGITLDELIGERFAQSASVPQAFFAAEADAIAHACWQMARRFHRGGRLLAFGNGAFASDAQHISVEFVHPVIVGKRALPALALTNDSPLVSGLWATDDEHAGGVPFARQLRMLARPEDIALGFALHGGRDKRDANVRAAFAAAQEMGLLTLGLTSGEGGPLQKAGLDFCFAIASDDPFAVQETHETLYHVLWELVHIFFEHEGLLGEAERE